MTAERVAYKKARPIAFSGLIEPYLSGLGVGKWDRVMTFGNKVQYDLEGIPTEFDFSVDTFNQIIDNFSKCFDCRRLGLDYRHMAAKEDSQPEQNLAYYSGLCLISDGKVLKLWDHDPAREPPNPQDLVIELQKKFPRIDSADGLWAYKCEVTPLGQEKLPNMEQLSPLFSKNDVDEFGNEIGYNLLNISAVGIAFQNGTLLSLSKPVDYSNLLCWDDYPNSQSLPPKGSKSMTHKMDMPEDMLAKLTKHGLSEDNTTIDEIKKALAHYMAETDDPKELRKAMADMTARCMDDLDGMDDGEASTEAMATDGEESFINKKLSKMEDADEEELKEEEEEEGSEKNDKEKAKTMSKARQFIIKQLAKENKNLMARLSKLEQDALNKEKESAAVAFAKKAVQEGRWPANSEMKLVSLAKNGFGEEAINALPKGTFTTMQRMTAGGKPIGTNEPISFSDQISIGGHPAKNFQVAQMARDFSKKNNVSLLEAYKAVAPKKVNDLYE